MKYVHEAFLGARPEFGVSRFTFWARLREGKGPFERSSSKTCYRDRLTGDPRNPFKTLSNCEVQVLLHTEFRMSSSKIIMTESRPALRILKVKAAEAEPVVMATPAPRVVKATSKTAKAEPVVSAEPVQNGEPAPKILRARVVPKTEEVELVPNGGPAPKVTGARKERAATDYQVTTLKEHVLMKPSTYVGVVTPAESLDYIYDPATNLVQRKTFLASEGLKRLFIEILSNAADNVFATRHFDPNGKDGKYRAELLSTRAPPVSVTVTNRTVTVRNGGAPVPIKPHTNSTPESLEVIPKVIFGTLLSSSNYDSAADRVGAGTNGYGAKLANIFSSEFRVRAGDPENGQLFEGVWRDNMSRVVVDECTPGFAYSKETKEWVSLAVAGSRKNKPYSGPAFVEISYDVDFSRFAPLTEYTTDIIQSFARSVLDYSFTAKILVAFNGQILDARAPRQFARYYFTSRRVAANGEVSDDSDDEPQPTPTAKRGSVPAELAETPADRAVVHYEWANAQDAQAAAVIGAGGRDAISKALMNGTLTATPVVELIVLDTPNANSASSTKDLGYVNGLFVPRGVHVIAAVNATAAAILAASPVAAALAKAGVANFTGRDVRPHFSVIVNCNLRNPNFTSQTKQELSDPVPRIIISPDEFRIAMTSTSAANRWLLANRLMALAKTKELKAVAKGDGRKQTRVDVPELDDANDAGKANSLQCTLLITEGESAARYACQRIDYLTGGKDLFGVFPIRGKPLNVLGASLTRLTGNKEYGDIKKCLGLEEGMDYSIESNARKLRYGRVLIIADADEDGSAIRSLLINMFGQRWPSLLAAGRLAYLATPAVRVYNVKTRRTIHRFFSDSAFDRWAESPAGSKFMASPGIEAKHIKGLATSDKTDVKEDVWTSVTLQIVYDANADRNLDLAFSKKRANDRKEWIALWRSNQGGDTDTDGESHDALERISNETAAANAAAAAAAASTVSRPVRGRAAAVSATAVVTRVAPTSQKTVSSLINDDLAEYSFGSLRRAIPSVLDNLNHARRKVIWTALNKWGFGVGERANRKSLRVTDLSAETTQTTQYMHGEKSLNDCIISLAQGFAGTSNIPILMPQGQYGDRVRGPSEAGAARYLQTRLNWIAKYIFMPDAVGLVELDRVSGENAESKWLPCDISLAVLNGVRGIATGWASFVPNHHPVEIVDWYLTRIANTMGGARRPEIEPQPWYAGFTGTVDVEKTERAVKVTVDGAARGSAAAVIDDDVSTSDDDEGATARGSKAVGATRLHQTLVSRGRFKITRMPSTADQTYDFIVEELPVGLWTKSYENWLYGLVKVGKVGDFNNVSKTDMPRFVVTKFDTWPLAAAERKIVTNARKAAAAADGAATAAKRQAGKKVVAKPAAARGKAVVQRGGDGGAAAAAGVPFTRENGGPPPPLTHENAGLVKSYPMNNMVLLQADGTPRKFANVSEILSAHFVGMADLYKAVKAARLAALEKMLEKLRAKHALVEAIVTERLLVYRRPKEEIRADIVRMKLSLEELDALRVTELNADDVDKLTAKIIKTEAEHAVIKRAHYLLLWESRLTEFRKELVARMDNRTLSGEIVAEDD